MNKPGSFIFKYYIFDRVLKVLELKYAFSNGMDMTETYYFDFTFADYDDAQLDRAIEYLLLIAGVSYFKAYIPPRIEISRGSLTRDEAEFFPRLTRGALVNFGMLISLIQRPRSTLRSIRRIRIR